jgi:Domain of unknown function (DUF4129)
VSIRAVRLPLALFVDVLWSYAAVAVVVAVLGRGEGPAPSIIGVAAVAVGSFALARVLQETDLDDAHLRTFGVAASAVALFAIIHAEYAMDAPPWDLGWLRTLVVDGGEGGAHVVVASIAMSLLWMRGVARGQRTVDAEGVLRSAAFGLVPVAIAAGSEPAVHGANAFGAIAIGYLALVLGVLALYQAPDPDRRITGYVAQWSAGVAVLLMGAAALAVVAAAIDPGALGVFAPIGRPLAFLFGNAAKYILGPPLAIIGWLFGLIPLPHHQPQQPQVTPETLAKKPDNQHDTPLWTRIIGWVVAGGLLALLGIGVLLALWLLFRRIAKRKESGLERRERIESESSLADDLGAAFDALARRFRRRSKQEQSRVEVRRLYHEMLASSAASGLARPPAVTPSQFAPRLDAHYASDVPSAISRVFVASRYGAREIDQQVVEDLRRDWRRIATPRL